MTFKGNTQPTQAKPSQRSSIASAILKADPTGNKNPFIRDGQYLFKVLKCEEKTRQGRSVVIEMEVLEASEIQDKDPQGINPVGSCVSYHNNIDKSESAAGNILAFFMALTGTRDKEDPSFEETLSASLNEEQLASGMLIKGRTFRNKIKKGPNAGQDFVGVNWTHVPPESKF